MTTMFVLSLPQELVCQLNETVAKINADPSNPNYLGALNQHFDPPRTTRQYLIEMGIVLIIDALQTPAAAERETENAEAR